MASEGQVISRRQFLRGDFSSRRPLLHPPWAVAEEEFLQQCDGCARCAAACPTQVILFVNRYPRIDFSNGECTFCKRCAEACPTGALQQPTVEFAPWALTARIGEDCLARQGVTCLVCRESCATRAISFPPRPGRAATPCVDTIRCNGCGACVAPCPAQAIALHDDRVYREARA